MNAQNSMKAMLRSYNIMNLLEKAIGRELTEAQATVLNETLAICSDLSNQEVVVELIKKMKAA